MRKEKTPLRMKTAVSSHHMRARWSLFSLFFTGHQGLAQRRYYRFVGYRKQQFNHTIRQDFRSCFYYFKAII